MHYELLCSKEHFEITLDITLNEVSLVYIRLDVG